MHLIFCYSNSPSLPYLVWVQTSWNHSRFWSKSWSKRQKTVFLGSFGSIAQNLDIRSGFYYPSLKEELISHKFYLKIFALGAKVCSRRDLEGLKIFKHSKWFFEHNFKTTHHTSTADPSKCGFLHRPSFFL